MDIGTDIDKHNERQRRYFSALKPTMVPQDTPYIRRHVAEMMEFAGITPSDRVLEVGCGMGRYTIPLVKAGVNVEGLDLSPFLLARLREYDSRIPLHEADVWNPPAELESAFDAVIGFFTLHHLHDLELCFASMARLVKPGGRIAFLEPNAFNPLYYLQVAITPGMTWEGDRGIADMRKGRVFPAMRSAGLTDLRVQRFGFFPPVLANTNAGAKAERVLEKIALRALLPFQLFGAHKPTML
jgi:SAM-dependent methyltransferase